MVTRPPSTVLIVVDGTSAAVERQFSGAGFLMNERRTSIKPDQVNNILFFRSCEKMYIFK